MRALADEVRIKRTLAREQNSILRAIPDLKEEMQLNVELASPLDFIPLVPGWEDRSKFPTFRRAVQQAFGG